MNILPRHYVLGTKYLVLAFFKAIATKIYHQSIVGDVGEGGEDLGSSGWDCEDNSLLIPFDSHKIAQQRRCCRC